MRSTQNEQRFLRSIIRRFRALIRWNAHDMTTDEDGRDAHRSIADLFEKLVSEAAERGVDEDKISSALDHATQATADVLTKRLRADAPRMLREHKRFRDTFERRLQQRWSRALDLYECVRVCCLEAGDEFHNRHSTEAGHGNDAKFEALTLLHVRACLVASEIYGLLRTGHAVGAQARWRTLHELAVIAFVLGSQDHDISERFLLHRYAERYKDAMYSIATLLEQAQEAFFEIHHALEAEEAAIEGANR